jgi:hypothetical protein
MSVKGVDKKRKEIIARPSGASLCGRGERVANAEAEDDAAGVSFFDRGKFGV